MPSSFRTFLFGASHPTSLRKKMWLKTYHSTDITGSCYTCNSPIAYNQKLAHKYNVRLYELSHNVSIQEANKKRFHPSYWFFDVNSEHNLFVCCKKCNRACSTHCLFAWAYCNIKPLNHKKEITTYLRKYPDYFRNYYNKQDKKKQSLLQKYADDLNIKV